MQPTTTTEQPTQSGERKKKTCNCFLQLPEGGRHTIGEVTLTSDNDHKAFAKKAYGMASASLKRLKLRGYKIIVKEGNNESGYLLEEFSK